MTLLDFIELGIIRTHRTAQEFAEDLVDCWHDDQVPGNLQDALGLTPREYQAWTTGGVSLLTIARWRKEGLPALDLAKPWFKLAGRPPRESVGYLDAKVEADKRKRRRARRDSWAGHAKLKRPTRRSG
jgi:hypothetical protein